MDSKSINPFLMDDYPAAEADASAAVSNPFLQDFGDPGAAEAPSGADANPFLSFGGEPVAYEPPAGDSTNPFAMFGAEPVASEPPTATLVEPESAAVPEADLLGQQEATLVDTTAPVEESQPTPVPAAPAVVSPPQPQPQTQPAPAPVASSQPPPKPARPAPPPRPGPPPAPPRGTTEKVKEPDPRQLVLSVTGAMDETSNQMMDRIHMTRTPSPTLMHPHSPSPTPEHSLAEHYDVDTSDVPDLTHDDVVTTGNEQPPIAPDNPFSNTPIQPSPFDQSAPGSKRPSIATISPPNAHQVSTGPFAESTPFGDQPSNYYAAEQQSVPPEAPVVSELVGGFDSEPEPTHQQQAFDYAATSPAPAQEFPATGYRSDEVSGGTGGYSASTKVSSGGDAFDAFASKFDQAASTAADPHYDPFGGGSTGASTAMDTSSDAWGDSTVASSDGPASGFDDADGFDSFLSMTAPPPEVTPRRRGSGDSDGAPDFSVVIKPREGDQAYHDSGPVPALGPPPKSPMNTAYADGAPRFNPFDKSGLAQEAIPPSDLPLHTEMKRSESQETPPTPLFDEDTSQPLEEFPRIHYEGEGWEMQLRMPIKKKITGQRFWKKVFVRLVHQGDTPVLQLFNTKGDKDPFQELPLLACYSVSEIAAQQFDQYGKIFTVKLQYIVYKERPGVRPGQVTKAERITNKLSQFAAYAIQGDYQGVKEFGSDLKKLGLPVEHAPQSTQLFKLGSQDYEHMKEFSVTIEEALFRIPAHRDRALTYKMEEVQISVVDELYVEQNMDGHVEKQIARVRLFFLGFLSGMHDVELGVNDIRRQGKEVVGRHDIIPMATEEWIRLENVEFHSCVEQDEWEKTKTIKFKAPDACYIELLRFRVRPPRNRELPLQLKAVMCVTGNRVELRADILVPGFASRKLGRVPCEDVSVRFPIPECWIYLFRVEKHFRYGSVKSAHRRTGKIKGIERFLGAVDTLEPQLMEVTSGQAKYEHQHHAIVWRMPRLPKEGQGAYTTHQLVCRMNLTSFDQIPEKLPEYAYVEFTMPCTQVSHTTARSCSFSDFEGDAPPEKYVRNLSRHEYRVGIEHTQGEGPGAYISATAISTPKKTIQESTVEESTEHHHPASDSDSSG